MRAFPDDIAGLPALVTIQKALTTVRFSTADRPLTVNGAFFPQGPNAKITGMQFTADSFFSNVDITVDAQPGGLFEPGEGKNGELDEWPATVELVDPNNPTTTYPLIGGQVGSVREDSGNTLTIAINGLLRLAQHRPLCDHYALTCRADLGDNFCKVPILADQTIDAFDIGRGQEFVRPDIVTGLLAVRDAYGRVKTGAFGDVRDYANLYYECTAAGTTHATTAPSYPTTVGGTVTDGTAQFIARNAFTRYAFGEAIDLFTIQFESLPDPRATSPTWFVYGGLFIRSGPLDGYPKIVIRAWDPNTLTVTTALPVNPTDIPAHTQFEIYKGCNLTRDACFLDFNNIVNGRFETFVPPPDLVFAV